MRLALASLIVATGAVLAMPAGAAYTSIEAPPLTFDPSLEQDVVAATEHHCLTLALYFEGGSTGESEEGQRHIARVIIERAKARRRIWGGSTICGVVFYRAKGVCQFSFACLPLARRTARKGPAWQFSAAIAREALEGRNDEPHELIRYYMNAELTPARNECRFRREFVPVVKAGRHEFFREPTTWERRALARAEFDACTRHEAELKAAAAKAAAKKTAKAKKSKSKTAIAKNDQATKQAIAKGPAKKAAKPIKLARAKR